MATDKKFKLIGPEGETYLSPTRGTLGGHRKSRIYGRMDCPSALRAIANGGYIHNRVFFADEETALAAGYHPCGICMRDRYELWKSGNLRAFEAMPVASIAQPGLGHLRLAQNVLTTDTELTASTHMAHDFDWPQLNVDSAANRPIEVLAYYARTGRHAKQGSYYKSLSGALLGKNGPARLFLNKGTNQQFRDTHGACYFFAAAEVAAREIVATCDGETFCLLSRDWIPNGDLLGERLSIETLVSLCERSDIQKRRIDSF